MRDAIVHFNAPLKWTRSCTEEDDDDEGEGEGEEREELERVKMKWIKWKVTNNKKVLKI